MKPPGPVPRRLPEPWHARMVRSNKAVALAALLKELKPEIVYECGAWPGGSSKIIRRLASCISWDADPEFAEQVDANPGHVPDYSGCDLAFIDCGPTYAERFPCIENFYNTAQDGTVLIVDDAEAMGLEPTHEGMHIARWRVGSRSTPTASEVS